MQYSASQYMTRKINCFVLVSFYFIIPITSLGYFTIFNLSFFLTDMQPVAHLPPSLVVNYRLAFSGQSIYQIVSGLEDNIRIRNLATC